MTNGEKYKSTQERFDAFSLFCYDKMSSLSITIPMEQY